MMNATYTMTDYIVDPDDQEQIIDVILENDQTGEAGLYSYEEACDLYESGQVHG